MCSRDIVDVYTLRSYRTIRRTERKIELKNEIFQPLVIINGSGGFDRKKIMEVKNLAVEHSNTYHWDFDFFAMSVYSKLGLT